MRSIFINGVEPAVTATVGLVFSFVLNNDNAQLSGLLFCRHMIPKRFGTSDFYFGWQTKHRRVSWLIIHVD